MIDIDSLISTLADHDFDEEAAYYDMLARLQRVQESFEAKKLYPYISKLANSLKMIEEFLENKNEVIEKISNHGDLADIDWEEGRLEYEEQSEEFDFLDTAQIAGFLILMIKMRLSWFFTLPSEFLVTSGR
jgi:hypothetical protein